MDVLAHPPNATACYLIPTLHRGKVAYTHSHPIGSEALSKALADVPQRDRLTIRFMEGQPGPHLDINGRSSCSVLRISYRHRSTSLYNTYEYGLSPNVEEPQWSIKVDPVLRTMKHQIRLALKGTLPLVAAWLTQSAISEGKLGKLELTLTFNITDQTMHISTEETLEASRTK